MEHFTINGSLFLAFANYLSDTAEKHNTDSFIYKFNDLTGKFFLYQTVGTHGGHDVEYFTISGKHYLAVANVYNGTTHRLNSVIYLWNGTLFVAFQNFATKGGHSFHFFTIANEPFLTVSSFWDDGKYSINSTIYKWKNNMFEKFQEIAAEGCRASTAFVINNESYIAFANEISSASSVVYRRTGMHFVKLQNLQKNKAMDIKSFYIKDAVFLAIASEPESYINKWKWESVCPNYDYPHLQGQDPASLCHVRSNFSGCGRSIRNNGSALSVLCPWPVHKVSRAFNHWSH